MSEKKERSTLFKVLYVVFSILLSPVLLLLYILKHPILVVFILGLVAGALVYVPMQEGVAWGDIPEWYKNKYSEVKVAAVNKAVESGNSAFVPAALEKNVRQMQKEMQEEALEASRPKGENYNQKIVRDEQFEETSVKLKKRGGFKKKNAEGTLSAEDAEKAEILSEEGTKAGGLAAFVGGRQDDLEPAQKTDEESEEQVVQLPMPEVQKETVKPSDEPLEETSDDNELDLF